MAGGKCVIKPTLVSDPDNSRKTRDAHVALTDDGMDSEEGDAQHNFWLAKSGQSPAHFVFDLGCEDMIGEVRLRNSHTGAYQKK